MPYEELKERQSVMWGNGPFDRIAASIEDLHQSVANALAARPGERVLDLGCGSGRVAELLAASGATVVGIDLAPGLIETAKERAAERGLEIEYRVGDCERLETPTRRMTGSAHPSGSCSRPTTRPPPRSWGGSRSAAGASPSRTGRPAPGCRTSSRSWSRSSPRPRPP